MANRDTRGASITSGFTPPGWLTTLRTQHFLTEFIFKLFAIKGLECFFQTHFFMRLWHNLLNQVPVIRLIIRVRFTEWSVWRYPSSVSEVNGDLVDLQPSYGNPLDRQETPHGSLRNTDDHINIRGGLVEEANKGVGWEMHRALIGLVRVPESEFDLRKSVGGAFPFL